MTVATKSVQIVARIEFKSDSRKVVYIVRSSDGSQQYQTSLFNGKACSCTCPARKPCYHMTQLQQIEAERALQIEESQVTHEGLQDPTSLIIDAEYDAWKRENALDVPLSREAYVSEYAPCELAVA